MPELVFFVGKGGVGKTTVSSAYAVGLAAHDPRKQVLLISSDPAHSLSDLFQIKIGASPKSIPIETHRNLSAWELDSERTFRAFVSEHKHELVAAIERGSLFTADEIYSFLESALPGMSEVGALLAIQDAVESGEYATIVVDTAPFGHTLRLFGLPEQFEKLLNFLQLAAERDQVLAQHFGGTLQLRGTDFIREWRSKLKEIRRAFEAAQLFLVTTPEEFALQESFRCIEELQSSEPFMRPSGIVLNRVVRGRKHCSLCLAGTKSATRAKDLLAKRYKDARLWVAEDPGFPLSGVSLLKQFAEAVFRKKRVKWQAPQLPNQGVRLRFLPAEWPNLSSPITFVLGKGGVGKSTISAALGFQARRQSRDEVEICSVDPAPSLDDVFQTKVDDVPRAVLDDAGFRASELDSVALYKRWVSQMRDEIDSATSVRRSGVQVDLSYEKQLFAELLEIVPPGLDEVLAIFRIRELSGRDLRKVIIDMAPTGHALELLRTPERILVWSRLLLKSLASHRKLALAREAAVKIAELEVKARELSRAFQDAKITVYAVMLAEPLPDRETERLLQELRELGIRPQAVFVNRVLQSGNFLLTGFGRRGGVKNYCSRCRAASAWQARVMSSLKKKLGVKTVYVIPAFEHGPAGKRGLQRVTRNLWQLS